MVEFSLLIAKFPGADSTTEQRYGPIPVWGDGGSVLHRDASDGQRFRFAVSYLAKPEMGLRAGDGLHLAVANNHPAAASYGLDKIYLRAWTTLQLPVSTENKSQIMSQESRAKQLNGFCPVRLRLPPIERTLPDAIANFDGDASRR